MLGVQPCQSESRSKTVLKEKILHFSMAQPIKFQILEVE
jgi:hypothetical protein